MTRENGTMTTIEILFALLRSELGGSAELDMQKPLPEDALDDLYLLAKSHDIAHVLSSALHKHGMLGEEGASQNFRKKQMLAVYRCERLKHTFDEICSVFEKIEIPYIPLKGSVLRSYYPEDWMRTSCDIDILIHEEDMNRAVKALVDMAGYTTDHKANYHDVSLYSKSGIHLELHFSIKEHMEQIDGLLSEAWQHSKREKNGAFRYDQTNEYFVFHHIAHMSYHFVNGGCGIKPFMDLYVIQNKMDYDDSVVRAYCRQCDIETFYDNVLAVTDVWFGNKPHTSLSRKMEEYILKGGVYGTLENLVVVEQSKQGSKAKYILSRIFIPYDTLKNLYPILKRHKWLFPLMQIRRWFGLLFCGKLKRGIRELKVNQSVSKSQMSDMRDFLKEIGL